MEALGAATLTKEIPAQRAVATIVPRTEILTVLDDPEASAELSLRLTGGVLDGIDEPVISMTWSRNDLEQLLDRATGDQIVLTFDRDQLVEAFADVEAHGLRERALVFAVAAVGALGSGAAIANAMPQGDEGGPVVTSIAPADVRVTDVSSGAGYTAPAAISSADDMVTDASLGSGYAAPAAVSSADTMVTDASLGAGYAAPAVTGDEVALTDVSSGGGYAAPASPSDSIVSDVASGGGYTAAATETAAADTLRTDASSAGGYGTAADLGGGSVQSVSGHDSNTTDALLAGGILLAIAGATFTARRSGPTARPA